MGSEWPNQTLCRWMGTSVSAIGRGHIEKGLPCQDASDVSWDKGIAAIVVSDGAGSARHSEYGSAGAVKVATQVLQETAPWTDPADVQKRILTACRAELSKRADGLGCPIDELAATLAFVAIAKDVFIAGNIGDGVVSAFCGEKSEVLLEPARGEFANETVFLTSSRASKYLRIVKKPQDNYDGFSVMSDGAADSLYQRRCGSLAPMLTRVLSWFDEHTSKDVHNALQDTAMPLLTSRSLDDCSLAMLRCVRVSADDLAVKTIAFQKEFLGSKNERGLRNRLAVLEHYRNSGRVSTLSKATGLSKNTVRRHRRALKELLSQ